MRRSGEYRILFQVKAREAMPLVEKGQVVAFDEILVKDTSVRRDVRADGGINIVNGDTRIILRAGKAEVVIDKIDGTVKEYRYKGRDVLDPQFGLQYNFWRAPVDNDYGDGQPSRAQAWRNGVGSVTVDLIQNTVYVQGALPGGARMQTEYSLLPNGVLNVKSMFIKGPDNRRCDVPRIGFRFHVGDDAFSYFGRGPMENYQDRNSGTFRSIYESSASAEYYPYVRPQETGHHTDVSWFRNDGLTIVGDGRFEFNALRLTVEDLDGEQATGVPYQWNNFSADEDHSPEAGQNRLRRQTHISDVHPRDFTEICIDYAMSGIGGYDSWGQRPQEERVLWSNQDYEWAFSIVPDGAMRFRKAIRTNFFVDAPFTLGEGEFMIEAGESVSIGTINEADGEYRFTLYMRNETADTLRPAQYRTSCGCAQSSMNNAPVPPGELQRIPIVFNPAYKKGPFEENVDIRYRDGSIRSFRIGGEVIPMIHPITESCRYAMGEEFYTSYKVLTFTAIPAGESKEMYFNYGNNTSGEMQVRFELEGENASLVSMCRSLVAGPDARDTLHVKISVPPGTPPGEVNVTLQPVINGVRTQDHMTIRALIAQ